MGFKIRSVKPDSNLTMKDFFQRFQHGHDAENVTDPVVN